MTDTQHLLDRLVGAWTLVEWSEQRPDGGTDYPLGADACGQIVYTRDGHVSAQLARRQVARFAADDWRAATPAEGARAFKDYFGYFGRFTIDPGAGAVVHHVEAAWFPNLYGEDQVRHFRFDGERLHLKADTDWGQVTIIWARAEAYSTAA